MFESVSDASFAPIGGRSVGAAQIFWAGSLVSWCGGRQPFAAASTAEAELLSLLEAFMLTRIIESLIATLQKLGEIRRMLRNGLHTDNTATLQLHQLESDSRRTRHIRLRAAIICEALENDDWHATHLPGLLISADIATKARGPQRLADLIRMIDLYIPHMENLMILYIY